MQVLTVQELDIIFEYLTVSNQIESIEEIYAVESPPVTAPPPVKKTSKEEPQPQVTADGKSTAPATASQQKSSEMADGILLEKTAGLKKIELREKQLVILEILKVFRDFCQAHRLRYFLAGGTLLGAVRHKGFIPWDEDADVYLPYCDYLRFINEFSA